MNDLPRRPLGSTGLDVSAIGFGAWQLGNEDDWGRMDDATAHDLVARALDAGINLFDTAPNYAHGNSERLLGEALRGRRDDVVLVSKFGHLIDQSRSFTVDDFHQSLHGTLERLQTDHVDVLLLHNPPAEMYTGDDPLWDALARAREDGKVRHYGASLDHAHEIEACLANTGCEVLEILFNVFHQDVRRAFGRVREHDVGTICKVPLDSGWLSGRYDASSSFGGIRARWSREEIERRAALVSHVQWLEAGRASLAAGALAFTLAYDAVSCTIPGLRTVAHLEDALRAVDVPLTDDERMRLEVLWDEETARGERLLPW